MKKHIVLFLTIIGIHAAHAQPHAFTEEFVRNPAIDYLTTGQITNKEALLYTIKVSNQ